MPQPSPSSGVVDVAAECADVAAYWFLGAAGTATATGFFVDRQGRRTGVAFSTSVPQANGSNDPVRLGTIPDDAVGAIVRFTGAVLFDITKDALAADFKTNYARYPQYPASTNVAVGRVNLGR
ncbi:MAG: hypothetical protein KIS66_05695 [Fimbriimonadaceae bacterium]|nr:hypothetical protein [Fimbriimonadaceae bacterium]